MSERNRQARDVLALPMVAYRGLWDRFARPNTLEAVRRAYRRGVPSLVPVDDGEVSVAETLAVVSDPETNPQARPVYLMASRLPILSAPDPPNGAPIRAVVAGSPPDRPWPLLWWSPMGWATVGCYVPRNAALDAPRVGSWGDALKDASLIVFESSNVRVDADPDEDRGDAPTVTMLRAASSPRVPIYRVSDMVELDQLERQKLEAA